MRRYLDEAQVEIATVGWRKEIGYPPNKQEAATLLVSEKVEVICSPIAV